MSLSRIPSLSIVLPCRDEVANVGRVARDAVRAGQLVAERVEVVVVDDGSTDGTYERVTELALDLPEVRVVRNPSGLGYGGALRRGFGEATMEWVFFTDGDGQFDMAQLPILVGLLEGCDVAIGYRAPRMDPPGRVWGGRAWTAMVNLLFGLGVRDVNCAFKLLPRALLGRLDLATSGAAINAELLLGAQRLGYRIGECAVRHRARLAGRQSGGRPQVAARAMLELARLFVRQGAALRSPQSPGALP